MQMKQIKSNEHPWKSQEDGRSRVGGMRGSRRVREYPQESEKRSGLDI